MLWLEGSIMQIDTSAYARQVLLGDESHMYVYEAGGLSALGGIAYNVVPTLPSGEIAIDALNKAFRYGPQPLLLKADV